ncbi:hypothetical protein CHCC14809_3811 [Bacillus licheniformis]|nr:hypothetical protein B4090_4073 [Bacillus licheniformis]TWM64517.1 hypothetical protein CHCC14814_3350 [Bacillus paralicheniformis]KYC84768.1 hypothetical protein B4091_4099 [Bacillus licheniformis]KYD00320.1 hypothetical protein B4164_3841 [Bacillus licheniformis]OLF97668.1 hypothetical protein B4094_1061 [Bacillus licheniformis]
MLLIRPIIYRFKMKADSSGDGLNRLFVIQTGFFSKFILVRK